MGHSEQVLVPLLEVKDKRSSRTMKKDTQGSTLSIWGVNRHIFIRYLILYMMYREYVCIQDKKFTAYIYSSNARYIMIIEPLLCSSLSVISFTWSDYPLIGLANLSSFVSSFGL